MMTGSGDRKRRAERAARGGAPKPGDLAIRERASPNHGPRRGVMAPDMVVLHYTAMASPEAALARLCDPAAEVSAHYLIDAAGGVTRLVSEARRAWHAGVAAWGGVEDVNSHSIGIELAHPGRDVGWPPYPEPQMAALEALLHRIRLRWGVPPERVLGHSDVAPGRKTDPGEKFDWRRLALRGLAIWSDAEGEDGEDGEDGGAAPDLPPDLTAALADARRLGYRRGGGAGAMGGGGGAGDADLLRALQMRFAPQDVGGPLTPRLAARLRDLAARHPALAAPPG